MNTFTKERVGILGRFLATLLLASPVSGHPGSGIVVDQRAEVYFVDTGLGVWKTDRRGRSLRHPGAAYHWMAMDPQGRFAAQRIPRGVGGDLQVVGHDPALILSSDFPVTVGSEGTLYYPQAGRDGRVRVMRLTPGGEPRVFATLSVATEIGPDGRSVQAQWIHGLAAGPNGSL